MIEREYYKHRFYEHYLTTHAQFNPGDIHQDLAGRAPYLRSLITKFFPSDHHVKVLDLGCGYGALLYFLKEAGYDNLQGVDTSADQVACAKQLGLDFVREGDLIETLRECDDCSYDFLIAFDVLEHFPKDEILIFTNEVYRVLRSGGRFVIHVPNGGAIFPGAVFFGDLTHETCFTRVSLRQLVNISGFSSIQVIEDEPIVHNLKGLIRFILWKFFRATFRLIYMAETGRWSKDLVLSQNLLAVVVK